MSFWLIQLGNGLAFSALLYLIAVGFTIIFGLMRMIKLTHGAFYALGGYVGLSTQALTGNFFLAVFTGGIAMACLGFFQYWFLQRRFHGVMFNHILLTLGLWFIYDDLILVIWGGNPQRLPPPDFLRGTIQFFDIAFPKYRVSIIILGILVGLVVWLIYEKTKLGAIIRAGADNEEIVRAMGINIKNILL